MTRFMAGKSGDMRESDMRQSEPLRSKLVRLYEQWDEAMAVLRQRAIATHKNIKSEIAQLRIKFDHLRSSLFYGDGRIEQLEMYFQQYVAEIEIVANGDQSKVIIKEGRKELDRMITDILQRTEKTA